MEKKSFWECFLISFQPRAYRQIAHQPLGRSFGYLALAVLVLSAALTVKYTLFLRACLEEGREWVVVHAPDWIEEYLPEEIRIEKGVVSTLPPEPFVREIKEKGQLVAGFIIDTTGSTQNLDNYQHGALLTENKLLWKNTRPNGRVKIQEQSLAEVELFIMQQGDRSQEEFLIFTFTPPGASEIITFPLTPESLKILQEKIARVLPWMGPGLFLHYLNTRILCLFLFSLITLFINQAGGTKLPYKSLLNIGIFALFPPMLLVLLVKLANVAIPGFSLVYFLTYAVFLILGLKGSRPEAEEGKI